MKFDVPVLNVLNERETETLDILIEPHLELYRLPPGKSCDVFYMHRPDNTFPEKTMSIAQRDDCIVIYPPGGYSPELISEGKRLINLWG